MKKKVVVAGHICLDITPVFKEERNYRISELLKPGQLLNVGKADIHLGGAVANTGLAMKYFGVEVSLVGKIGQDTFGEIIQNKLREHQADSSIIVDPDSSTAYSIILAIPGIDRIFFHNNGANDIFCEKDIPEKELEEAALLHIGYPPLMKKMYEQDGEELVKIFQRAKKSGAATSLDMASVDPNGSAGKADWMAILKKVIPYTDFFVPSVEELCYMLDRERFAEWNRRAEGGDVIQNLDVQEDILPLADHCIQLGAKVVLIKCGAKGMLYKTASEIRLGEISQRVGLKKSLWSNREGFEKSYVPERVLSGTGAGDTCIAAFLAAMLQGYGIEECVKMSAGTGACCVAAYDALSGLLSFQQLQQKIENGWKKV